MTSKGDSTLFKNNKSKGGAGAQKSPEASGTSARRSLQLKWSLGKQRKLQGAGLSQTPAVRIRFIFGPRTESRKPHPLTSFSLKILHSSIYPVE